MRTNAQMKGNNIDHCEISDIENKINKINENIH
jgi:hypothetical protein